MSSTTAQPPAGLTVKRIPDPTEPVPAVAWPTVALLALGYALWFGSAAAYLTGTFAWWVSIPISAAASYMLFTVAHDAAHHTVSSNKSLNDWLGRFSTPLFAPHASLPTWRFIHMQHHRFTNHDDGSDPDGYTMRGPAWQRPFRWITIDLYYMVFYLPKLSTRPRQEQIEEGITLVVLTAVIALSIVTGNLVNLLVVLIVPCRLAVLYLAWAFDYLPHNGLRDKPSENKLRTTRNRIGLEFLVSPLLLYQNYHLVHHLHPLVPFYRYIAVWRRNEEEYLEGDPALSTVRGRELTSDEYRQMRELAGHHHA